MIKKNTYHRVLSSIIVTPIVLFLIIIGNILFTFFLIFCFIISFLEWKNMTYKKVYFFPGLIFLIFSYYTAYYLRILSIDGLFLFLFVLVITIASDLGGYIFGNIFKGPKLGKISPKKTYSGVIGSYFFSIIITYFYIFFYKSIFNNNAILEFNYITVLIISTVSQAGDLTISFFKRKSNIKDTGNLIPGHGGILDRTDGIIFALPFFYFYLNYFLQ